MPDCVIYNYQETRDKDFIFKAFKENWNLLVDVSCWPEYSVKNIEEDLFAENREIRVLVKFGISIGFIVYRPNKPNKYYFYSDSMSISILFIDPLYRGNGYANVLINYAVQDMLKQGNKTEITAVINEDNISSLKAFKKAGFEIVKVQARSGLSAHIHVFRKIL